MNIFYLDHNIEKCAQYHCDKHVVKMITEHTQLLSIACRLNGYEVGYNLTHKNHPCAIWTRASEENFLYLADLTEELHKEWRYRYGHPESKIHGAYRILMELPLPKLPSLGFLEPYQAMPEEYKVSGDSVSAYRKYYIGSKKDIVSWKIRGTPEWYIV